MKGHLLILFIISCLVTVTACSLKPCTVKLEDGIEYLEPESEKYETMHRVTVEGKIDYVEKLGGYVIRSEKETLTLRIVNQDPELLADLLRRGQTLAFEGHFTIGKDRFFINKVLRIR